MRPQSAVIPARSVLLAAFVLACSGPAFGQASLMTEDRINEVKVKLVDGETSFTIVRDAFEPEQFYYIPDQPRLVERKVGDKDEPEFHLVRYNLPDPTAPGGFTQGGILQFSAILAAPPEAIEPMLEKITERFHVDKDRVRQRLAALPLKEATVSLYSPQTGTFVAAAPLGQGIAPTFATQKMAFSIPLTKVGSAVYDELIKGKTGIGVCVTMKYQGLTPPVGYDITVHWSQLSHHYSTHDKFATRASWFGLFGASASIDSKSILEELTGNRLIDVKQIDGEGANFDTAVQAIVSQINQELAVQMAPPDRIEPANAAQPDAGGFFGGNGYTHARVERTIRKSGDQEIKVRKRQLVERATVASGYIGIGKERYAWTRDKLVTDVTDTGFRNAYFLLPSVGDSDDLGIKQVNLQIELLDGDVPKKTETRVWSKDKGWTGLQQGQGLYIAFALPQDSQKLSFRETFSIVQNRTTEIVRHRPVFDGQIPVAQPQSAVEVVVVDGGNLSFDLLDRSSPLQRVSVRLVRGDRRTGGQLVPYAKEDKFLPPKRLVWLPPCEDGSCSGEGGQPISAQISFFTAKGVVNWGQNGKNLRDLYPDPQGVTVHLRDSDWKEAK
jgi:hypothetical protein